MRRYCSTRSMLLPSISAMLNRRTAHKIIELKPTEQRLRIQAEIKQRRRCLPAIVSENPVAEELILDGP